MMSVILRGTSIILALTLLAACDTGYKPEGFKGGYSESQVQVNAWRVNYRGNGFTSQDTVNRFLLIRNAELTIEQGYQYFIIVDENQYSTYTEVITPMTNNMVNQYTYTPINVGQNIEKSRASNVIIMTEQKPTDVFSYNAAIIMKRFKDSQG